MFLSCPKASITRRQIAAPTVSPFCRKVVGSFGAFHLGLVAVAREHQVGEAWNVNLGYQSAKRMKRGRPARR